MGFGLEALLGLWAELVSSLPCSQLGDSCIKGDLVAQHGWVKRWPVLGFSQLALVSCGVEGPLAFLPPSEDPGGRNRVEGTSALHFPSDSVVKNLPANAGDMSSIPGLRRTPWRWKWQPTPVSLSGKSHGQRSLAGYSPWGCKRVGHDWATKQ